MTERGHVAAAYENGSVRFMGIDLIVERGTVVPRNETELLGRTAIDLLGSMGVTAPRVIDMCCGAGNLACAIAHHAVGSRVWASDLTDACVGLARRNVAWRNLAARVSVHQGDLFEGLRGLGLEGTIDILVCNPPYISEKRLAGERAELLELEPVEAFAAGPYGIGIHQRVVRDAAAFLRPGGILLVEVGLGQHRQVQMLFERSKAYEDIRAVHTAAGDARAVLGQRRADAHETRGESG